MSASSFAKHKIEGRWKGTCATFTPDGEVRESKVTKIRVSLNKKRIKVKQKDEGSIIPKHAQLLGCAMGGTIYKEDYCFKFIETPNEVFILGVCNSAGQYSRFTVIGKNQIHIINGDSERVYNKAILEKF